MANSSANIQQIDLLSSLNLDVVKTEVSPFTGMNERNSPYINQCLHRMKHYELLRNNIYYGNDTYEIETTRIKKNGETILNFANTKIEKYNYEIKTPDNAICEAISITGQLFYMANNGNVVYDGKVKYNYSTILENADTIKCVYIADFNCFVIFGIKKTYSPEMQSDVTKKIYYSVYKVANNTHVEHILNVDNIHYPELVEDSYNLSLSYIKDISVGWDTVKVGTENLNSLFFNVVSYGHYVNTTDYSVLTLPLQTCCCFSTIDRGIEGVIHDVNGVLSTAGGSGSIVFDNFNKKLKTCRIYKNSTDKYFQAVINSINFTDSKANAVLQGENKIIDYYKDIITKNIQSYTDQYSSYTVYPHEFTFAETYDYGIDLTCSTFEDSLIWNRGYSQRINNAIQLNNSEYGLRLIIQGGSATDNYNYTPDSLIGISCGKYGDVGTILIPWGSIDNDVIPSYNDEVVVYKDDVGNYRGLALIDFFEAAETNILFNRFLVVNTVSYYNCIDMYTGEILHIGSDWNNRYPLGTINPLGIYHNYSRPSVSVIASSVGGNYEITNTTFPSGIFSPLQLTGKTEIDFNKKRNYHANCETVDIYSGDSVNSLKYYISVYNEVQYINPKLIGIAYPLSTNGDALMNIPFFAESLKSLININLLKIDDVTYKLLNTNNSNFVGLYNLGSEIQNITSLFCIQGQFYSVQNNNIYSVSFDTDNLADCSPILNCQGLEYVGNSPKVAVFFSSKTRKLYAFNGSRDMTELYSLSEYDSVKTWNYDPASSSLLLAVKDKVLVLVSGEKEYIYTISQKNVTDITIVPSGFILKNTSNNHYKLTSGTTYGGNLQQDKVKLRTQFYGVGNNRISVVDCWYLKLFSGYGLDSDIEYPTGTIRIKTYSLTNIACNSDEKVYQLTPDMWDKTTHMLYLRHQSKLQRGAGIALEIESDFDINDIQCSYTVDSSVQLSNENMKVINSGLSGVKI